MLHTEGLIDKSTQLSQIFKGRVLSGNGREFLGSNQKTDRVSNVSVRRSQLEDAYDKLVEHFYELSETDLEPVTAPQVMAEYLNRQMLELISTADSTMIR